MNADMARKKTCYLISFLALMALSIETDARVRDDTIESLQKIKTSLTSAGKNVDARVDTIIYFLNSSDGSSGNEVLWTSIEKIGDSIPSLMSTDTTDIVKGTMDVISGVKSLIPFTEPVLNTVFSLTSVIISAIGGGIQDIGSIVRREIEQALNRYDDSQLRAEASGTARIYRISHAYLSAKEGQKQILEHELASLAANVPVYQGVKFLGILASKIKQNVVSEDVNQVKRAMEYTKLYVTLAVLRSAVMWEMYSLVRTATHSNWTAAAIARVAQVEENTDKDFIQYLVEPEYSQAVFFAHFHQSQWPEISHFLEKKGLSFQSLTHLANGVHTLRPEKWTDWYMIMNDDRHGSMRGRTYPGTQGQFYFDVVSSGNVDNVFHLRPKEWPSWYVYMHSGSSGYCYGWDEQPGPQGEWKIVKFSDGKYMLSPLEWPNWFIYMKSNSAGSIRGWEGDPGIQGHWIID